MLSTVGVEGVHLDLSACNLINIHLFLRLNESSIFSEFEPIRQRSEILVLRLERPHLR